MRLKMKYGITVILAALAALTATEVAVAQGAGSLTPVGAEKAGNKEGAIPEWTGGDKPTGAWSAGQSRGGVWKYKGEKPLFTIDASNVDKYADKLTPGQVHMLKTWKGYSMPVYPSHRGCGAPDFVVANTKKNAEHAKIGADGWSLEDAVLPGVPFPQPKSGIEALWNHLMRYQGVANEWPEGRTYVSPAPGSDKGIEVTWTQFMYWPWAAKGANSPKEFGNIQSTNYYAYSQPAALAGQAIVQRFYTNKETESFYYFPGQRRVRRLPAYAYDAPLIGFENQYPADTPFVFYGSPDRFDWKIVGKKEIYVPYNAFDLTRSDIPLEAVAKPNQISPEVRRYELHRVWEIVGTVKQGVRHSAPKKAIYLDEDSWVAVVGDDYDAQGKLWKTKENNVVPVWELGGACPSMWNQHMYDFVSGRYVADLMSAGGKQPRAYMETKDPRAKSDYFTAESLRANSER